MTVRIALALVLVVPAAMAYPWQSTSDRWLVGGAAAIVVVLFAWWRGLFVTTMVARRFGVWLRNLRRSHRSPGSRPTHRVTVLLRVSAHGEAALSVSTIARYVDRFGIRCDKVRLTSLDRAGDRTTWIGMTIGAEANLAALQARSAELPLAETAEVVGRRLADRLREAGLDVTIVDTAEAPLVAPGRERWRAVEDGDGVVSAHAVTVDSRFAERLAAVWAHSAGDTWTCLEFGGTARRPTVAAMAVFRGTEASLGNGLDGVVPVRGRQRPVLGALDPRSVQRLGIDLGIDAVPCASGLVDDLVWRVDSSNSRMVEQTRL